MLPEVEPEPCCDVLTFDYRLTHRVTVTGQRVVVPVEVKIVTSFQRCPGPMSLGDVVYTTTLLPGEKVRLFTTDRRTRFTFDSSTKVSAIVMNKHQKNSSIWLVLVILCLM